MMKTYINSLLAKKAMEQKTIKVLYWIITILFVLFMLMSASFELLQTESAEKALTDLGYPAYLNYIIGVAKVLGAIALIQWKWRTIKEWAYAGFTIDIVGAAASTF